MAPTAAAMAAFVVMVGAVNIRVKYQLAGEVISHHGIGCTGNATEQLDASLHQGNLCASADAAAESDIDPVLDKEADQRTMALAVGGNDFTVQDGAVLGFVNLELGRTAKVLEHLTVFVGNSDFHNECSFLCGLLLV